MEPISTITVLGAGTMGRGIANVAALAGYETRLYDTDGAALEKAEAGIHRTLAKGVELKKGAPGRAARGRGAQDRNVPGRGAPRPAGGHLRLQHLGPLDHRDGRRLRPARALRRHAL